MSAPDTSHAPASQACWEATRAPQEVFACLARAAVPVFAHWCEAFVLRGEALALVAWSHAENGKAALIPARRSREGLDAHTPSLTEVVRGAGVELVPDVPGTLLPALSPDMEHLRLTRALGLRSYVTVPVGWAGTVFGVLRLVRAEAEGFDAHDVIAVQALAEGAGRRLSELAQPKLAKRTNVEARYRALVQDSPQAVEVWSRDGRLLEVNAAWEKLIGLRGDDLARFNLFEDEQLRAADLVGLFERSFLGERVVFPAVLFDPRAWRAGTAPRWLRTLPLPVRDARGRVQELIVVHELASDAERLAGARRLDALGLELPRALDPRAVAERGPLSPREAEVLRLVAQGLSNKQIASALDVSERTAKFHVTSILNKLGADTRARAVALAAQQGMV